MNNLEIKSQKIKWHWSSTEDFYRRACMKIFKDGYSYTNSKLDECWVRAVRRVKK